VRQDADSDAIQDYVDDRLDATARTAFERRLATEPELARRVASLRELGRALRAEEPLPAGFHDRLRARVARTEHDKTGAKIMPWWGTAVAAAAALVLLVGVPYLIRSSQRDEPTFVAAARTVIEEPSAPPPETVPTESERPVAEPLPPPPAPPIAPEYAPAPEPSRAEPDDAADSGAASPPPPPPPVPQRESRRITPSAAAVPGDAVRLESRPGIPLPAGLVPAESVETFDRAASWQARLQASGQPAPAGLEAVAWNERVVVVGAAEGGFDCEASLIVETDEVWSIRPGRPARPESGAPGCAWIVPRDGRTIEVEWP
jgi:hypothetical protein